MIYTIQNEKLTLSINSKGAELVSAKSKDGREYIWQADKRYWGRHAPILFPVCGRLLGSEYTLDGERYEMGSHGFARDSEFELMDKNEDSLTLVLSENEHTASVYPFNFTLKVKYCVENTSVKMFIEVKNNSNKVMPYMIGWHPGFCIEGTIDNYTLSFPDCKNLKRHYMQPSLFVDQKAVDYPLTDGIFPLDENEIYREDTIIFKNVGNESILRLNGKPRLRLSQSDNLPFYAIWKAPYSEAEYICLEPWSDIPSDGVTPECFDTREMSRLEAGKSESYFFSAEFID
ncbi:MAG: aldose 1-epimerase family protein [Clostridia bacterium]|nr:aldose 1-epimerase family protein [Clostridia bacterium]